MSLQGNLSLIQTKRSYAFWSFSALNCVHVVLVYVRSEGSFSWSKTHFLSGTLIGGVMSAAIEIFSYLTGEKRSGLIELPAWNEDFLGLYHSASSITFSAESGSISPFVADASADSSWFS